MQPELPKISSMGSFIFQFYTFQGKSTSPRNIYYGSHSLYDTLKDPSDCYNVIEIPKHGGPEMRTVFRLAPFFAEYQDFVRKKILTPLDKAYTSSYAYAYRKGISIRDNGKVHEGCRYMLKLDIRHFFESTRKSLVFEMFRKYTPYNTNILGLLTRIVCKNDFLCQGTSTAPQIVNLILADFDNNIGALCEALGIRYSRYCDDMIFSSKEPFPYELLINFVRGDLKRYHYRLNEKKTCFLGPSARKSVTGTVVNDRVRASRSYRKKVRQDLYYMDKYGVKNHLDHTRPSWYSGKGTDYELGHAVASLKGRISFIAMLDPDEAFLEEAQKTLRNIRLKLRDFCLEREKVSFDFLPSTNLARYLEETQEAGCYDYSLDLPSDSCFWENPIMTDESVPFPGDDDAPEDELFFDIEGEGNDPL